VIQFTFCVEKIFAEIGNKMESAESGPRSLALTPPYRVVQRTAVPGLRRIGGIGGGPGAGEGLPQAVNGAGDGADLLG
jgi:hypothetical protein